MQTISKFSTYNFREKLFVVWWGGGGGLRVAISLSKFVSES